MTRALLVGTTDYSHQSFQDMVDDLGNWLNNLTQVVQFFEKSKADLEKKGYWAHVSFDVQGRFEYALKFFKTSISEINDLLEEMQDQVQENHVNRFRSLAKTAAKVEKDVSLVWHEDPWDGDKDYGNPDFAIVETMYREIAGMAADMIDLSNLALRLTDFVGKKGNRIRVALPTDKQMIPEAFVDSVRLAELRSIKSQQFDLTKLVRICEELNTCYVNGCYMATAMLVRAILDHVPPIFGLAKFSEVSNNYKGSKSFKESMEHLQNSLRNVADHHLHVQVRSSEVLPTKSQVNFIADVDVLLAEIVRLLKQP